MAGAGSGNGSCQPIQDINDMGAMGVFRLLERGRSHGKKIKETKPPKKGYLDTQLFPDKKKPKAED